MWIIPVGLSIRFFYIRFILIWFCFTIITFYVTRRATRQPIQPNTPRFKKNQYFFFQNLLFRLVYKWFLLVYKISYGLAIAGYFIIMISFIGINTLFSISPDVKIFKNNYLNSNSIVDFTKFWNINNVLWNLLWCTWKRYGRIMYRSNGIKIWRTKINE
jgi:hypothetical protein